jgi:hypothetical protein
MKSPGTPTPENGAAHNPEALSAEAERQIQALVEDYLDRRQAGDRPDLHALLLHHFPAAQEAERRLAAIEVLCGLAETHELPTERLPPTEPAGPVASRADDLPSFLAGRYELRERLGNGSSAVVYRAYDTRYAREIALKVFKAEHAAGSCSTDRFERDARIAAQLRHAHIVPFHEAGEEGGRRYIDMELIPPGRTLETQGRLLFQAG